MNPFETQSLGEKTVKNNTERIQALQESKRGTLDILDGTLGNLQEEADVIKKSDDEKIAKIMTSLGIEQPGVHKDLQQYVGEHLDLQEGTVEKVRLLKAKDLPTQYQAQLDTLHDKRLDAVTFAVVPDDMWKKGEQPSESDAERQLVLIRQSYFEAQERPDEIAWISHELAHCQNFLESESGEVYQENMKKVAFEDLKTEHPYPNNPVEKFAFSKQFQYLKEQGKTREEITSMLGQYYDEEDLPFFNRVLDGVYS